MSKPRLTIFCNANLDDDATTLLAQGTGTREHNLVTNNNHCFDADVAFGQPDLEQIIASKSLRWIHLTSAGYTRYDSPDLRAALQQRGAMLTNSSHVFDAPCAQHVLAMMLADARQLPDCYESQRTDKSWHSAEKRDACYLLNGQTVLLLGLGAIALYLIRLLEPFDMKIIAVRQSEKPAAGIEVVAEAALDQVLPRADHVVNMLPENPSTFGFMDAGRFGRMKAKARFYNVGRGKTVHQPSLLAALETGRLGAAYLDVTDPEPLPPDHALWTAPRCFITPHAAGGHQDEATRLVRHFLRNLRAFEAGEELLDRVY